MGFAIHRFPYDYHKVTVPISFRQATFLNEIVIKDITKFDLEPTFEFTPHGLKKTRKGYVYRKADYLSLDKQRPLNLEFQLIRNRIMRWMPFAAIFICLLLNLLFALRNRLSTLLRNSLSVWVVMAAIYTVVVEAYQDAPSILTLSETVTIFDLVIGGCLLFTAFGVAVRMGVSKFRGS